MRLTQKLALVAVPVLLANCALPSDTGDQTEDSTAALAEGNRDSREGLVALRDVTRSARVFRSDAAADALAYVSKVAESVGVDSPSFKVLSVTKDPADKLTHVRLQQTHDGVLVWGADCVVHLNASTVLGASGSVATKLKGTKTVATISPATIMARAKADRFGTKKVVTQRELTEKVVLVDDSGVAHVAIHTAFFNELQGDIDPAFWNHVYDANSGELLARWNDLHTATEQASGPSGNPKVIHHWNSELDVDPNAAGLWALVTPRLKTVNMKQAASTQHEVNSSTLETIGDAAINDAHGYAEIALNMMKEWMGRNSIDDNGFRIVSRVHYNRNYENAFWDGQQMTYGDGANTFYPLSGGLDVCAHEINHGYTAKHSRLAYSNQPGGLNEGFSDIAGKTAEFYYKENPNFDLGGDVFKQEGRALRYMCNPTQDGRSIDHARNMRPTLDPHYSSGVPNKAFCLSAKRMSSGDPQGAATKEGVKKVGQAFFLANGSYWTASSTFVAGCQGTLDAGRALGFTDAELQNIKSSWEDVGVVCNMPPPAATPDPEPAPEPTPEPTPDPVPTPDR